MKYYFVKVHTQKLCYILTEFLWAEKLYMLCLTEMPRIADCCQMTKLRNQPSYLSLSNCRLSNGNQLNWLENWSSCQVRFKIKRKAPALVRATNILSRAIPYNMGWAEGMLGKSGFCFLGEQWMCRRHTNLCTTLTFNAHQCQLAK